MHTSYSGKKAFPLSHRRRYRMISPFLFSDGTCETAFQYVEAGYAGRSEDGACLRL
jgi:hypothetical protein